MVSCDSSETFPLSGHILFNEGRSVTAFYECANRYIKCADIFLRMREKRLSNARLNFAEINCFYRYFKVYRLYFAIKTEVMIARFIHSSSVSQR